MKKNKLEIDYLEVVVDVNHKPEEVASWANSNMRCDSLKSLMIINKLSKFL